MTYDWMVVDGVALKRGGTVAFDYARKTAETKDGNISRIGEIDRLWVSKDGTALVTIREDNPEGLRFRSFFADAMVNVIAE
jgi:hypothetical protein